MSSEKPKIYRQTTLEFSQPKSTDDANLKRKHSGGGSDTPSKMSSFTEIASISRASDGDTKDRIHDSQDFALEDSEPHSPRALEEDNPDANQPGSDDEDQVRNAFDFFDPKSAHSKDEKSFGCPLEKLPQFSLGGLPTLRNEQDHCVFFIPTANLQKADQLLMSLSGEYKDNFNSENDVKMPCSTGSKIPDPDPKAGSKPMNRWELIEKTLKGSIPGTFELEEAILTYNQHYRQRWDFDTLHSYFIEDCDGPERDRFFTRTLPKMVKLALSLPCLFNKAIPFLRQRRERKLTFSQQQVACLLANAFFCTFPRRNFHTRGGVFPDINFSSMFAGPDDEQRKAKIKCIVHYFTRVTEEMPRGVVTYARRCCKDSVNWESLKATKFSKLHMSPCGTIEDKGEKMLQADFANKYVGGGVLGHGCVQEEIRFLICPEMIISRLFTEVLMDDEVLVMTGCERFSSYEGYSKTFRWKEDYIDTMERDEWGRICTEVVAMDALHFRRSMNQFERTHVKRELDKAYCAFREVDRDERAAVCTGNWGCGAFGGNAELKALIQIMAASQAKRDVCYLSVGNEKLCRDITCIHEGLKENGISVGELFNLIMDYSQKHTPLKYWSNVSLLEYLAKNLSISFA